MHLVYYVKGFPPRETGGSVEVACHVLRELLKEPDIRITILVQTASREDEIRDVLETPERLSVVRLKYYPSPDDIGASVRVARLLRDADLIHFNEFPFRHMGWILLAKLRGLPRVFSLHGFLSAEADTIFGPAYPLVIRTTQGPLRLRIPSIAAKLLVATYRSFARQWSAVVTPSHAMKQKAATEENFDPGRVTVIPHGVDLPDWPPAPPRPHDGPLRMLFVGMLERVKGPDLLLDALGMVGEPGAVIDLGVVGRGSLDAELRERSEHVAPHRVTFHGFVRGPEVRRLYEQCDVVVVPSRYESFSLVVLEAMAAGRPVIATAVGGIPELVKDPRNALLVEPDPASIASGIRRMVAAPELRAAMSAANLEDVQSFRWSSVARRYTSLYRQLVREPGSNGPPSRRRGTIQT